MSAERFIDLLETKGLLDDRVIDELRRRVAKIKDKKVTPEAIAKFLVDKGHLTQFQATRLVSEITSAKQSPASQSKKPTNPADDGELGFAPDENDVLPKSASPSSKKSTRPDEKRATGQPATPDEDELIILDGADDLVAMNDQDDNILLSPKTPAKPRHTPKPSAKPTPTHAPPPKSEKEPKRPARPKPQPTPPAQPIEPVDPIGEDLVAAPEDLTEVPTPPPPRPARSRDRSLDSVLSDTGAESKPMAARKLQPTNQWDSKLLLIGGASLGVLLVIGALLLLSLTRGSAEDMIAAANKDYESAAYARAIKRYDQFLKHHSGHDEASHARVFRALARLRQVYKNSAQGLKVAKEILPDIEKEDAFDQARPELASMLPQIADGFIQEAKLSKDTVVQGKLLAATEQTMVMVNNATYIPTTLRRPILTKIQRITEDMARVRRDIKQETSLVDTIQAIEAAVASDDTPVAYAAREKLLGTYPGLERDERLQQAVAKISEKERDRVRMEHDPLLGLTDDYPPPGQEQLILAHQHGTPVSEMQGQTVYTRIDGCLFALDASDGNVLWRRYVGIETTAYPVPVSTQRAGADAIAVDGRHHELLRLDAKTGKLVWRLPVGQPLLRPVVTDKVIYVATPSGKLLAIDPKTGQSARRVILPQTLEVPPGHGGRRPYIYQPGEHDNLYVLDADSLECQEVFYIGHKAGTITVPPVMALGYLIVVENGPDYSKVHIIGTDKNGLHLKTAQDTIRLRGRVLRPPIVGRRRVLLVTDRRAIELYDVDPNNESGTPLTPTARHNATSESPMLSYAKMEHGYIWIANNRFSKYQVQAATGKLPAEWVTGVDDTYVAPIQLVRDLVVSVRQRKGSQGVVIAAMRVQGKDPVWQTEVSIPILQTIVHGNALDCVTGRGRLFQITAETWKQNVLNRAQVSASKDDLQTIILSRAVNLADQQWFFSDSQDYTQLVTYKLKGPSATLGILSLTIPPGDAAAPPSKFGTGLLIPLRTGQVAWVGSSVGAEKAHPFAPELPAGTTTAWTGPTVLADGKQFVIADNRQRLYRVGIKEKPEPFLVELNSVETTDPLIGRLANTADTVFAATRSDSGDSLAAFKLPNLEADKRWPLKGRVLWGPVSLGDLVLVATENELLCVDRTRKQRWLVPLQHGVPAGRPLADGSQLIMAFANGSFGSLDRIDANSGKTIASVDVGQPLTSGPIAYGNRFVVAGTDGTLFVLANPTP